MLKIPRRELILINYRLQILIYLIYSNKNFKLTIQLFKDMFRHDSCHHQFNVLLRFPLFYTHLQFEYVNNLKFKNAVTVTILRVQVHKC